MNLNNLEVRTAIEKKRLKYYEVAHVLGIHPGSFSRWLQCELDDSHKRMVLDAIRKLK